MQETDKRDPKEELLAEALDACMEEQLSFIPPECEIARMHTFSENFREYMEKLLKTKGRPERKALARKEFIYSFNKAAAGILIVLAAGGMLAGAYLLSGNDKSMSNMDVSTEMDEAAPQDAPAGAAIAEETEAEAEAGEESAAESLEPQETPQEDTGLGAAPQNVEFMGKRISLADNQNLPEKTESIKTLVNSPVIARDAESVKVTIGNMEEYPIYYYSSMDLEVLIDGAWYLVTPKEAPTEEEENHLVRLEPGMAQDEEIFLENYDLDYEAEMYRTVTYLDGLILCSRFRFENPEEDLEEALEQTWE